MKNQARIGLSIGPPTTKLQGAAGGRVSAAGSAARGSPLVSFCPPLLMHCMNTARYLVRSLFHYWRTNLAVLLGVIAGTAVISGALVVGDSVRYSLSKMSLDRLGRIDHVLSTHRFVREELARALEALPEFQERFEIAAPALAMEGSLVHEKTADQSARVSGVNIYGVDERLWKLTEHGDVSVPIDNEIVLSPRAAEQLGVQPGDDVTLWIELPSSIPRDMLLGDREQASQEILLSVKAVFEPDVGAGRLELNPNQQLPLTAFVSLDHLQSALGLAELPRSRRNPVAQPARVNALFVSARQEIDQTGSRAAESADLLTALLSQIVTFEDLHLRLVPNEAFEYLSLESEQMILENEIADLGRRAAEQLDVARSPVLVYLANEIRNAENSDAYSMYSIVAGLDIPQEPPFGPFERLDGSRAPELGEGDIEQGGTGEILVNEWLAKDLEVETGDDVELTYHVVGSHGELPEEKQTFRIAGVVKLGETPAADRGLTPEVKGVTDADTFSDWDQPFPMKLDLVTPRDDQYWDAHRATPKAFVSMKTAQHLWRSRYGQLTSLRVAKRPGATLEETADAYRQAILAGIVPAELGLAFQPVKFQGVQAANGTTPFSALFLGFSFFLILSAMILIGLLFRLGIERRGGNIGLLAAVGLPTRNVRRLFLTEGLVVVGMGALLGTAAAVGYASLMVYGLKTWWFGAVGTKFLYVSVQPASLAMGFVISVVIAMLAVSWALRAMRNLSTRELLSGVTEPALTAEEQHRRARRSSQLALICTVLAGFILIAAMAGWIPAAEAFSGYSWHVIAFFVVGMAALVGSLAYLGAWIDSDRAAAVRGSGMSGMGRLGMRNAARHRQRSLLSVGLIASATFVIVAVAAAQRNPAVENPDKQSGNGGFTLVAETSTPILYDLNTEAGRDKLDIRVEDDASQAELLDSMHVVPFRVKPGENSSCLNLYQTHRPTILGVTPEMIERGGFKFADTRAEHPWTLLTEPQEDGTIPVLGDMNTLMYSLKKGIGSTIAAPGEENPEYVLKIVGMFDGSVFQGVLLMSNEHFQRLYPEQAGYQYFLIETPPAQARELSDFLETQLTAYGLDAEPVAERLAGFLAVQNTYLSTFQTLGGLGLLLGTLGLGTVMLRNVLETRAELALLRAVGFQNGSLAWLVLWENAFLLIWGLLAGTVSALLAMFPHLMSTGADAPWISGGLILAGVFLVGMAAALLAVAEAVRTPILATLRSE